MRRNGYHPAIGRVNRAGGPTPGIKHRINAMQPFETVYVDDLKVACEGTAAGGHPRVYLNLATAGRIECPYCSRLFILKGKDAPAEPPPPSAPAPSANP